MLLNHMLTAVLFHHTVGCLAALLQNENQFVVLLSKLRVSSCKTIASFTYKGGFCQETQIDGSAGG